MKRKITAYCTLLISTLLIALVTAACAASPSAAENSKPETDHVILPLYPLESAQDARADGGYPVSFSSENLKKTDNGYELTAEVFEYDRYEPESIQDLNVGSKIQFCGQTVAVEEIKKNEATGLIEINGGLENEGFELREEDGLYRTVTLDDYPVYYSVGQITLPFSEDITLEDHSDLAYEPDGAVTEAQGVPAAIQNSDTPFTCANTIITVRQEQIVQIIRYWVP